MIHKGNVKNSIKILDALERSKYAIFYAPMQSGKTKSYLHCACDYLLKKKGNRVVILCGTKDITLKKQLKNDIKDFIKEFCEKYDTNDLFTEKIEFYFSQDLNENIKIIDDTLIIHDESHYAQSKNNIPFKNFYKTNNIHNVLNGDFSNIENKNIKILTVSATPFSEILQNNDEKNKKIIVYGYVSKKYKGVDYFNKNNMIRYVSKPFKTTEDLLSIIKENEKPENGYNIIRTCTIKHDKDLMQEFCLKNDYVYVCIDGTNKNNFNILNNKPSKNTIIHICGKARMGYAFEEKKYINMVYETSKNIKLDTCLQGLLGRMCGYSRVTAIIYLNKSIKKEIENYLANNVYNIKKATNLENYNSVFIKDKNGQLWVPEVPIEIPYQGDNTLEEIKKYLKNSKIYVDNLCSHRNITKKTYKNANLETKIKNSIHKYERFTFNFSNGITENNTENVKNQTLMYGGNSLYLLYFTKYVDTMDIMDIKPRVKSICNYSPYVNININTEKIKGQMVIQPIMYDFTNMNTLKINIKESIRRTTQGHKTYIKGAQKMICPLQTSLKPTYIHMNFKTINEVRNYLKNIQCEMLKENIKIKFNEIKKTITEEKGKIKIVDISWIHI